MLQLIVILLTAYIVTPLIDLCFNERVRLPIKIAVYLITFVYVVWTLFAGRIV